MPPPASSGVHRHQDGRRRVRLELTGEVDPTAVEQAIRDVAAARPGVVVLDLRRVSSVDSASLERLLEALRAVGRAGLKVAVMPGAATVRRVLLLNLAGRASGARRAA